MDPSARHRPRKNVSSIATDDLASNQFHSLLPGWAVLRSPSAAGKVSETIRTQYQTGVITLVKIVDRLTHIVVSANFLPPSIFSLTAFSLFILLLFFVNTLLLG